MNDSIDDKIGNLKRTHNELMVEYVNIINYVSKIPFYFQIDFDLPVFRYIIQIFVESHIKGKLNQIGDSYIQLSQTIKPYEPSASEYQNWLTQAKEGTDKFASTLTSLNSMRGIINLLWLWVSGLILAIYGASSIYQAIVLKLPLFLKFISLQTILIMIILILYTVFYFNIFLTVSFILKRQLFLFSLLYSHIPVVSNEWFLHILPIDEPYMELFSRISKSQQKQIEAFKTQIEAFKTQIGASKNVYQIENELFNILGKQKTLELPFDIITYSLLPFAISITGIYVMLEFNIVWYINIIISIIIIFFFILGSFLLEKGFKRTLR